MFATVAPENPAAGWFKINDPIKAFDRIKKLVSQGFVVRTRADADTVQSRKNDVTQRDKALSSGAQFVSTDYASPTAASPTIPFASPAARSRPTRSAATHRGLISTSRQARWQRRPSSVVSIVAPVLIRPFLK